MSLELKLKNILIAVRGNMARRQDLDYVFQRAVLNEYARMWTAMHPDVMLLLVERERGVA